MISKTFDGFNISFQYAIDADNAEPIEVDLQQIKEELSQCFYLLYQGHLASYSASILEFIDDKGDTKFKYGIELREPEDGYKKYSSLLPEGQIVWAGDWILHKSIDDDGIDKFFVILERVSGFKVRSDQPLYSRPWLSYERTAGKFRDNFR